MTHTNLKDAFSKMSNVLGTNFLNYILNTDFEFKQNANINKYSFNSTQLETIGNLDSFLKELIKNNSYNDTVNLHHLLIMYSQTGLYNKWRIDNNGKIIKKNSENKLLDFILKKAINYYPSFLIKGRTGNLDKLVFDTMPFCSKIDLQKLTDLVKNDSIFKHYYKEDSSFKRFVIPISDDYSMLTFPHQFVENLVYRSFKNCCLRICYDLESFLEEVEFQFHQIYKFEETKEYYVSHFYGLKGVHLTDYNNIELSKGIILRNVASKDNPFKGIRNVLTSTHTDKKSFLSGSIIEIKQLINSQDKLSTRFNEHKEVLDLFKKSLPLALRQINKPLEVVFYDYSTSFHNKSLIRSKENTSGRIEISVNDKEAIEKWMKIVEENYTDFEVTFDRYFLAVYERNNPIDSILDCFIVWESLLSENSETTFKISTALHFLLKGKSKYDFKFFKKLYALRSTIVHGSDINSNLNKFSNYEIRNINEMKNCVLQLTLQIISEIVEDECLKKLNSSQRIKKIIFGYH